MPNEVGGALALSGRLDGETIEIIRRFVASPEEHLDRFARGFTNSRGVVTKSLREGGAQERELVRKYKAYADAVNEKWSRTAAMLREIADFYERDAVQSDTEVEIREHLEH